MFRPLIPFAAAAICSFGAFASGFDSEPTKPTKSAASSVAEPSSEPKSATKTPPAKPAETKRAEKGLPKRLRSDDAELPAFTPEREAAALTFATRHHPELAELLAVLAKSNRAEYETAIRELFGTSEAIAHTEQKDPIRAGHQLEAWKIHSRIQLLTARLTMDPDDGLRAELEAALQSQIDQRLAAMESERKSLRERIERLEETSRQLEENRDRQVQRQLELLTRGKNPSDRKTKDADAAPAKP